MEQWSWGSSTQSLPLANSTGSHVNNSGRCRRVDYQLWVLIYGRIRCARQSSNSISGHNVVQASIQWQIQTARKQIMVMRYKTLRTNQCASSSRHVPPSSHQDAHSKSCSKLETSESCLWWRQWWYIDDQKGFREWYQESVLVSRGHLRNLWGQGPMLLRSRQGMHEVRILVREEAKKAETLPLNDKGWPAHFGGQGTVNEGASVQDS